MNIRDIASNDYTGVDELMQQLHKVHVKGRPDLYTDLEHPYSEKEFTELILNPEVISILAEEDAEILGICFANIKNKSGMVKMRTAYIDDLVIKEEYRQKGIAKQLFGEIERRAKSLGAERMDLMVWSFNENACKLYESLGMTPQRFIYEKQL